MSEPGLFTEFALIRIPRCVRAAGVALFTKDGERFDLFDTGAFTGWYETSYEVLEQGLVECLSGRMTQRSDVTV